MSKNPWVHPFDVLSVELFAMAAAKAAERSGGDFLRGRDRPPEPLRAQLFELVDTKGGDVFPPLANRALSDIQQAGQGRRIAG